MRKTISHYEVLEELGRGGMGVVYKARDTKLDRLVALKFLPEGALSPQELARIENEARAISALNHRNIATIHQLEIVDGEQFIVFEFLPGGTLKERIRRQGRLSMEDAISIASQVSEGLAHAHANHIIHRDIKSENIMFGEDGNPKITDFGISKIKTSSVTTRTDTISGTISYMSPEQLQGSSIDVRSDIWSLGVVLYEMLTGTLPFEGNLQPSLIYAILTKDASPLGAVRPDLPSHLQAIVMRCLEKDPGQRFQSAGELLQALRGDRQAISKMLRRRTTRTATRYWWLAAVIGVLLLAYLIVPIGSEHQELPSVAVLYLKNLGPPEDEALSYGITNALIVDLARAGWLHVTPIKDILSLKDAALSSGEIAKQFDVRHLVEGSIFRQGDEFTVSAQLLEASTKKQLWGYHLALSKSELATLEGNMALAILKALRVSPSPQAKKEIGARRSENPEAYEYYLKGRYRFDNKKSKEDVVLAQGFFEKARALDPGMLLAFLGLGEIHVFTGENEKARQLYTEALTIAKTHGERSMEAAANRGLGNLFSDRGEYPEALAYYTLGHTIVHEIGDSLEEANILHDIGLVYGNQSNYQTSLDFYRRSLRLAQALGDDHGQAQTLSKIGQVFYSQSDFPEALSHYTLALKFAGKVGDHVLESRILNGIANIYEGEGDYYNALNVYRRNLETIRLLGDRRGEGITCINLGLISYDLGDFGPALEFYERADTIFTELGNRRNLGLTWTNIAMVLDEEKEYSRALDYYTRGISTASEIGDTANATMRSHFLGISYFRQKNFRRAIDNFRTAEAIFYRMQDTIAAINSSVWLALALNRTGKEAEVRATANTIDTLLNAYSELDDPVGVYWNMSQIFSALHDSSRARRYLVKAFTIIRERRDKIPDEKLRKSFLSNITVNRDVMNAWNSSPGHN